MGYGQLQQDQRMLRTPSLMTNSTYSDNTWEYSDADCSSGMQKWGSGRRGSLPAPRGFNAKLNRLASYESQQSLRERAQSYHESVESSLHQSMDSNSMTKDTWATIDVSSESATPVPPSSEYANGN